MGPMCTQKIARKAKLTKLAFNPRHPMIAVGEEKCAALKLIQCTLLSRSNLARVACSCYGARHLPTYVTGRVTVRTGAVCSHPAGCSGAVISHRGVITVLKLSPNLRQIAREKRPEDEVSTSPKKPGGGLNIAKVRSSRPVGRPDRCYACVVLGRHAWCGASVASHIPRPTLASNEPDITPYYVCLSEPHKYLWYSLLTDPGAGQACSAEVRRGGRRGRRAEAHPGTNGVQQDGGGPQRHREARHHPL